LSKPSHRPFHKEWAVLLLIIALGATLRLWQIGALPPGLYQDEAYNGLDALRVDAGERPLYFPANNGREPFYIYLVALSVSVLGRTPAAERLPAALIGIALIPATYALGRALFGRRVGLLGAAVVALTFWPLALSRIGFRAGSLPLLVALSLACAVAGWRSRRPWQVILGGIFYGLAFYTYLAVRFTPLALFAFLIFWYIASPSTAPPRRWLVMFATPAALVVMPFALLAAQQPGLVLGRVGQVSILNPTVNGGDLWGTLFHNLEAALGMFVWRGDEIARHNLPGRAVFDPLTGAVFVLGVAWALWRMVKQRDRASALTLIWVGVMLLPTVLAEDTPHFLRAVGVLPVACLFPALGMDAAISGLERQGRRTLGVMLAVLIVVAGGGLTVRDYFGRYVRDPNTGYLFQSAAADLALKINATIADEGEAYLDRRLWDNFPSLWFLILPNERLIIFDNQNLPTSPGPGTIFLWPYEDQRPALSGIPPGMMIVPRAGPLARGDLESEPYSLYSVYELRLYHGQRLVLAEFEGGLQLLWHKDLVGDGQLRLLWYSDAAPGRELHVYTAAFVEETLVAQADGPLGTNLYPSDGWRAGEVVLETRTFNLPTGVRWTDVTRLQVGVYDPNTGQRLPRTDTPGDILDISP